MNIADILTAVGVNSILLAVIAFFQNRHINNATAKATERSTEADYTKRILEQADDRVNQAIADRDRVVKERDEAYLEAKAQRKAKQEWRDKFFAEQAERHAVELKLKDSEAERIKERYYRCEVECPGRVPPRELFNTDSNGTGK